MEWGFILAPIIILSTLHFCISVYRVSTLPKGEFTAKVVRKNDKFFLAPWSVVFQEMETGKEFYFFVPVFKYDNFKVGQVGTLFHRWGRLRKFEIEADTEDKE